MNHVVVASTNPSKINAVSEAFSLQMNAEIIGVKVESGVAAQPISDSETKRGALQRLAAAKLLVPNADYWVAIEAGIEGEHAFAWIIVENQRARGESRSASFLLPTQVREQLAQGIELGEVMSALSGIHNVKHKTGAIGILTNGLLTRSSVYQQALLLAMAPLQHPFYHSVSVE